MNSSQLAELEISEKYDQMLRLLSGLRDKYHNHEITKSEFDKDYDSVKHDIFMIGSKILQYPKQQVYKDMYFAINGRLPRVSDTSADVYEGRYTRKSRKVKSKTTRKCKCSPFSR